MITCGFMVWWSRVTPISSQKSEKRFCRMQSSHEDCSTFGSIATLVWARCSVSALTKALMWVTGEVLGPQVGCCLAMLKSCHVPCLLWTPEIRLWSIEQAPEWSTEGLRWLQKVFPRAVAPNFKDKTRRPPYMCLRSQITCIEI